jgi:hypothetical protein
MFIRHNCRSNYPSSLSLIGLEPYLVEPVSKLVVRNILGGSATDTKG